MSVRVENRVEARAAVLIAARVIGDAGLERIDDVVEALEALQYGPLAAERLALLVSLAFGRVALKAKGVEHFAWTVRIEAEDDVVLQHELGDDPIFLEALRYAVESFEGSGLDEETSRRLAEDSAEVGAARKAEAAGEDVREARIHETVWRSRVSSDEWRALGATEQEKVTFPEA
jgi:hypothetical protein